MEDRRARADRWIRSQAPIGTVEPEWWLRMVCGQLAEEDPAQYPAMRRLAQRAAKQLRERFGARFEHAGLEWVAALSRRNLPHEPAWWARHQIP